ncbi:hypothetical protein [Ralstonia syzygii]|uniref:hypothetical protein n=1 Tax=Ralstonia syzygii TaxID=28097 RepID=UPI0036F19F40
MSMTPEAIASSLTPLSIHTASMAGAERCCSSFERLTVEVPISGITLMPVALVKGSATH